MTGNPDSEVQLAHSKSALKRWRQNERARERNKPVRTAARSAMKKARTAAGAGGEEADAAIREAASILDRAAKRKIIHPNAAARSKSRLMRGLNKAMAAPAAEEAPKRAKRSPARAAAKPKAAAAKAKPAPKTTAKPRAKKAATE